MNHLLSAGFTIWAPGISRVCVFLAIGGRVEIAQPVGVEPRGVDSLIKPGPGPQTCVAQRAVYGFGVGGAKGCRRILRENGFDRRYLLPG